MSNCLTRIPAPPRQRGGQPADRGRRAVNIADAGTADYPGELEMGLCRSQRGPCRQPLCPRRQHEARRSGPISPLQYNTRRNSSNRMGDLEVGRIDTGRTAPMLQYRSVPVGWESRQPSPAAGRPCPSRVPLATGGPRAGDTGSAQAPRTPCRTVDRRPRRKRRHVRPHHTRTSEATPLRGRAAALQTRCSSLKTEHSSLGASWTWPGPDCPPYPVSAPKTETQQRRATGYCKTRLRHQL